MGANWFKFEFPNSAPFFVKGFDLHIIRTDSSSLAKGGGILTYKDSKEGWRQLEAIIITYIKRSRISLCVCIHYNPTFPIDFVCVCVCPPYMKDIFSHDAGSDSASSLLWVRFFCSTWTRFRAVHYCQGQEKGRNQSKSISENFCLVFLFLTNRLDTPLKIDTSIYYSEHFYDFILESLFSTILGE
jgi:hypothetical protein